MGKTIRKRRGSDHQAREAKLGIRKAWREIQLDEDWDDERNALSGEIARSDPDPAGPKRLRKSADSSSTEE